ATTGATSVKSGRKKGRKARLFVLVLVLALVGGAVRRGPAHRQCCRFPFSPAVPGHGLPAKFTEGLGRGSRRDLRSELKLKFQWGERIMLTRSCRCNMSMIPARARLKKPAPLVMRR
ncbi:hypothetical protein AB0N19_40465, partial [Streptomyces sp. NPDC051132]|uniref:hypothetical protein n=1 Tax=Streptomyces sp. NPDC051132 TaxID=3155667 RepID=UPI00343CD55E